MAGLTIVTTIGVIILAVILFIILIAFAAGLVVAIFALPIVSTMTMSWIWNDKLTVYIPCFSYRVLVSYSPYYSSYQQYLLESSAQNSSMKQGNFNLLP